MFKFGDQLKNLRKSKNITQKQLAENIGTSERGIQNYEIGVRKPTYDILISIADYFNVSLDYLVGRSDDPTRPLQKKGNSLITNNELHNFTNKELQYFSHEQLAKSPSELLEEIQSQNLEIPSAILEKIKNLCS